MDVSFHYTTKRSDFGRNPPFDEPQVRVFLSIEPDPDLRAKFCPINPFSLGIQASVSFSCHSVNTEVTQTKVQETVHREGSWPQGVDPTNQPSCKQMRLKVEKKETFLPQLKVLAATAEKAAKINVALDLFSDHFKPGELAQVVHDPALRTISILRDKYTDRSVSSLSWSFDTSNVRKVAICYTPQSIQSHYESFIYNLECPSVPEFEVHPPSPLLCLEFNQKDSNFLVGGMTHGSLSLWDIRQGSLPIWTSAIEQSHRDGVYAVRWISSKTAFECVSVSADGTTMTWDTRNQTSPLETVDLSVPQEQLPKGISSPFSGRVLDYHTAVPTKYMVGTIDGLAMVVNRKAADPSTRISGLYAGHSGPVYAVRRHPTDTKYFATVSDWAARVWSEDNKNPITYLPAQRHYLTNAIWGQGRTTVLYTTNSVGTIDGWDLIQNLKEPVCSISVGTNPIRSISIDSSGKYIIVGDSTGTSTLLELNEYLTSISQPEKSQFTTMMGREAKRVKNYDQFLREQKMRAKGKKDDEEVPVEAEWDPQKTDEEFEAALRGEAEKAKITSKVVIGEDQPEESTTSNVPPPIDNSVVEEEEEEDVEGKLQVKPAIDEIVSSIVTPEKEITEEQNEVTQVEPTEENKIDDSHAELVEEDANEKLPIQEAIQDLIPSSTPGNEISEEPNEEDTNENIQDKLETNEEENENEIRESPEEPSEDKAVSPEEEEYQEYNKAEQFLEEEEREHQTLEEEETKEIQEEHIAETTSHEEEQFQDSANTNESAVQDEETIKQEQEKSMNEEEQQGMDEIQPVMEEEEQVQNYKSDDVNEGEDIRDEDGVRELDQIGPEEEETPESTTQGPLIGSTLQDLGGDPVDTEGAPPQQSDDKLNLSSFGL